MNTALIGGVVLAITIVVFFALLPRGGKRHRLVETEWEPYVGVAICAGVALGCSMLLSGIIESGIFGAEEPTTRTKGK